MARGDGDWIETEVDPLKIRWQMGHCAERDHGPGRGPLVRRLVQPSLSGNSRPRTAATSSRNGSSMPGAPPHGAALGLRCARGLPFDEMPNPGLVSRAAITCVRAGSPGARRVRGHARGRRPPRQRGRCSSFFVRVHWHLRLRWSKNKEWLLHLFTKLNSWWILSNVALRMNLRQKLQH